MITLRYALFILLSFYVCLSLITMARAEDTLQSCKSSIYQDNLQTLGDIAETLHTTSRDRVDAYCHCILPKYIAKGKIDEEDTLHCQAYSRLFEVFEF